MPAYARGKRIYMARAELVFAAARSFIQSGRREDFARLCVSEDERAPFTAEQVEAYLTAVENIIRLGAEKDYFALCEVSGSRIRIPPANINAVKREMDARNLAANSVLAARAVDSDRCTD